MKNKQQTLQPTLWRTCRVLANPTRLKMLQALFKKPNQTVSQVAKYLGVPATVASVYLRALNARGLLRSVRKGAHVRYGVAANPSIPGCADLVKALRHVFERHQAPVDIIFRQATAFTHPRRIVIMHALQAGPRHYQDIRLMTGISLQALMRHLKKLADRGFLLSPEPGQYCRAQPGDGFSRELVRLIRITDTDELHLRQ